jgi:hypothetical protein
MPGRSGDVSELQRLMDAAKRGALDEVKDLVLKHPKLVHERDEEGATALHYAALGGHRDIVQSLVQQGADINARDTCFGATPAGWAIEYLRGFGAFLGIELADFAHAIRSGDVPWVLRFLDRFPRLRDGCDADGKPFRTLAVASGNVEIRRSFESGGAS